eukprot:2870818-Prymnesium_polylepis.1
MPHAARRTQHTASTQRTNAQRTNAQRPKAQRTNARSRDESNPRVGAAVLVVLSPSAASAP